MIAGKRIVGDEPIADVADFGRTYSEVDPLVKQIIASRNEHNRLRPPYAAPPEVYNPWNAKRDALHNALMSLYEESTRRGRANLLTPAMGEPLAESLPAGRTITERSFLDGLMRDAISLFLGGKVPKQSFLTRSPADILPPELLRQVQP